MRKIDQDLLMKIFETLLQAYGPQSWWPGDSPWEICIGAVLTQNTNWGNVEKAIKNLKTLNAVNPEKILAMKPEELEEAIRPSGYFRLKAKRLRNVTEWWLKNVENNCLSSSKKSMDLWRQSLLAVNGVGPETADSILLYSFNLPTFVVDTYTKRIFARHFGTDPQIEYHDLRAIFMNSLPADYKLFNEFHALIVQLGKELCRKNTCELNCPLRKLGNHN
jgi:endonuclease-3 related protein